MHRRRIVSNDSEEGSPPDEDHENNHTQTQSQKSQITPQDISKLAGLVCNFILVSECKKIPAKRGDIKKLVLKDKAHHMNMIMKEANNIMEKVFGFKIKELQGSCYILLNLINVNGEETSCDTEAQAARLGLITSILAAIFMTGDKMQEAAMQEYLKTLGLDLQSKEITHHPLLGNVYKLIHQDLVREKYLQVTMDNSADPPCRQYQWGERATFELSKKDILELVCKVYGDNMRPEVWTSQWKEVNKETGGQDEDN